MSEKSDRIIEELGYKPAKTKTPQIESLDTPQGRDCFQTPNYATDLLIPFIPKKIKLVWECACGGGKIVRRLEHYGLGVYTTDIIFNPDITDRIFNFVTEILEPNELDAIDCIITNPPFSLKRKFYYRCLEYKIPFALLIPADYSGWIINACWHDGAEKIIPTRRIDYITPSGKSGATGHLADFHSMWLTWGFGLGKTETFVELSLKDKKENI